ncbi:hypothetical protein EB093_03555 [bacterium]|nr:hypothetical protein [bacterium]
MDWISRCVRILVGIMLANIVSMTVMILFNFASPILPWVYVVSLGVSIAIVPKSHWPIHWTMPSRTKLLTLGLILGLILSIGFVRLPYVLEGVSHQVVAGVTGDDAWHIQEITSLLISPQFPPKFGIFQRDYLLFYYAPWMMIASLKWVLPVAVQSVKVAYFLGYLLYVALVIPVVFGLIRSESQSLRTYWVMIFLVVIHAGMQSFNSLSFPFTSHENWMGHYHIYVQFSAFSTLMLWVVHHVLSAVALVLAYQYRRQSSRVALPVWREVTVIGGLLAFAIMSSPFVCLGAGLLGVVALWHHVRWVVKSGWMTGGVTLLLVWPLAWMYFQKQSDFRWCFNILPVLSGQWTWVNWILSFALFSLLIIMEFIIPFVMWIRICRHRIQVKRTDKVVLLIALGTVISTFFVGYGIYNNYAMRSSILPVFVGLLVLARYADHLPELSGKKMRLWFAFWIVMMTVGSLNEIAAVWKQSYRELRLLGTHQSTREMVYQVNRGDHSGDSRLLWRIGETNASYYHLLERPLPYQFPYHENDRDLIGPPPAGVWARFRQ